MYNIYIYIYKCRKVRNNIIIISLQIIFKMPGVHRQIVSAILNKFVPRILDARVGEDHEVRAIYLYVSIFDFVGIFFRYNMVSYKQYETTDGQEIKCTYSRLNFLVFFESIGQLSMH